jgi:hypothetical protein
MYIVYEEYKQVYDTENVLNSPEQDFLLLCKVNPLLHWQ